MNNALLLVAITIAFVACKKDDEYCLPAGGGPVVQVTISDFSNLATGNYWVYERTNYDSTGVYISGPVLDSLVITGDSVYNGSTYAVQRRGLSGASMLNVGKLLRDSANCIVDQTGDIVFQYGVFDQVAWTDTTPNVLYVDYTLSSSPSQQVVPAGSFNCYNWHVTNIGTIQPVFTPIPPARYPYHHWSPGIGKVKMRDTYSASGWLVVSELLRYHVQ